MDYKTASTIARYLSPRDTLASKRLAVVCERYNCSPTFAIMKAGNPHDWTGIPHVEKRGRPSKELAKAARTNFGKQRLEGPFVLRNLETGRNVTALTVPELCAQLDLDGSDATQQCIANVVTKRSHSAYGWYLASVLDTPITLQDIYGNQYPTMTIQQYAKRFNRPVGSALRLLGGHKRFERDLALASTPINPIMRPRKRRIRSVSMTREGVTVTASSIPKLARLVHMDQQHLYKMAYGFKDQTNGFHISDSRVEEQMVLSI